MNFYKLLNDYMLICSIHIKKLEWPDISSWGQHNNLKGQTVFVAEKLLGVDFFRSVGLYTVLWEVQLVTSAHRHPCI